MYADWIFVKIVRQILVKFSKINDQHLRMQTHVALNRWWLKLVCGLFGVHFSRSDVYGAITFLSTYWVCF